MSEKNEELESEELDGEESEDKQDKETEEESQEQVKEEAEEAEETEEEAKDDGYKELENRYLRLQADFSNYKKRNEKEREGLVRLGVESLAVEILPVIDNFERAMAAEECQDENFYQGMDLIRKQLIEVLEKQGIKEIDGVDEPFDPEYHYAVQMVDSRTHKSNCVIEIIQKGYTLKDKVIRPAMVIVSN